MERIRGYIPGRVFTLTERQQKLAETLAQYPESERRTRPVMEDALAVALLSSSKQNVTLYLKRDEVFEMARYIANGWDFEVRAANYVTGVVWTEQMERFCWEIVCDPAANVVRAAKRVGLEPANAKSLITTKDIKTRIAEIREERKQRFELKADRVLERVLMLSMASLADFIEGTDNEGNVVFKNFADLSPDEAYAVQQITRTKNGTGKFTSTSYKIKLEDRGKNLALLMRHLGLLEGGSGENPEETGEAIRKWAAGMSDFIPGGKL